VRTNHWADGTAFQTADGQVSLTTDLYLIGSTFFSLGLGGVAPRGAFARALVVVEAGIGFGFLAMVISYLPVIYQAVSRREITISLLAFWADPLVRPKHPRPFSQVSQHSDRLSASRPRCLRGLTPPFPFHP
jgi:Ion channel